MCAAKVVAIHLDPLWPLERFTKIAGRAAAAAPPTRSTVRRMGAVKGGLVRASVDASLARDDSGSPHAAVRCRPMPRGSGTRQGTDCMCAPWQNPKTARRGPRIEAAPKGPPTRMRAAALVPLLLRGTHAEETAEQRYVRAARARCPPPPPGRRPLRLAPRAGGAGVAPRRARRGRGLRVAAEACVAAPGALHRGAASFFSADGSVRAAAARAVVARGGSSLAAPGLLARALLDRGSLRVRPRQLRDPCRTAAAARAAHARVMSAAACGGAGDVAATASPTRSRNSRAEVADAGGAEGDRRRRHRGRRRAAAAAALQLERGPRRRGWGRRRPRRALNNLLAARGGLRHDATAAGPAPPQRRELRARRLCGDAAAPGRPLAATDKFARAEAPRPQARRSRAAAARRLRPPAVQLRARATRSKRSGLGGGDDHEARAARARRTPEARRRPFEVPAVRRGANPAVGASVKRRGPATRARPAKRRGESARRGAESSNAGRRDG